jgi:DNA-binding PadR family transcriptional regulator
MNLSNTSYVILGILAEHPASGYDIKQHTDKSTRHFWAISYGQIYPELKRLTDAGLVRVEESPTGSRQRHIYRITDEGTRALVRWVSDTRPAPCEIRDEMLLKLFFSDIAGSEVKRALANTMSARHTEVAAGLQVWDEHVKEAHLDRFPTHGDVLRIGIDLHTWLADWYARYAESVHPTTEEEAT